MNNYLDKKYNVVRHIQGSHSELGLTAISPIFGSNSLWTIFKLFFLTAVNHHCVERRIKVKRLNLKYQEIYVANFDI